MSDWLGEESLCAFALLIMDFFVGFNMIMSSRVALWKRGYFVADGMEVAQYDCSMVFQNG